MTLLKPAIYRNGIWNNPVPTGINATRDLPKMLRKLITGKEERVPKQPLGPFHTDVALYQTAPASGLRITLIGHSSLLVEIDGTTLLIDPVFSDRASMVQWFGPKRFYPPPLRIEDLPPLDAILLTHDHYDHLDTAALQQLEKRKPLFICSAGVETHLERWGVGLGRTHPLNWMDSFNVPSASLTPLTITAVPARHFSGRSFKRYRTLWSSFVLQTKIRKLYHGADSGYYDGFREIGEQFGPFDFATLEIGAFDSLWQEIHLGPDNAVRAAQDLRTKVLMPIHWGLFNLAFHAWNQPVERITELAEQARLALFVPEPGRPTEFTGKAANSLWWRQYRTDAAHHSGSASSAASALVHG